MLPVAPEKRQANDAVNQTERITPGASVCRGQPRDVSGREERCAANNQQDPTRNSNYHAASILQQLCHSERRYARRQLRQGMVDIHAFEGIFTHFSQPLRG